MFETHDNAEIEIETGFAEPGVRQWRYIKKPLHTHWFHVTYESCKADDELIVHIVFLSDPAQLEEFSKLGKVKILQVELVSPKYMNGSNSWKMETLKEIWQAEEPSNKGQFAYVFILGSNAKYVYSAVDTPEQKLVNKRIIFSVLK